MRATLFKHCKCCVAQTIVVVPIVPCINITLKPIALIYVSRSCRCRHFSIKGKMSPHNTTYSEMSLGLNKWFTLNYCKLCYCFFLWFIFQIGCLVSSLLMLIFRASESALWMGTSTFGLFMSNVFPTSVALAEQYFNVTGTLCFSNSGCCISPDSFRTGTLTHFGVNAVKTVED